MYFRSNKPRSFGGKSFSEFQTETTKKISIEIENKEKEYILSVDETAFKTYLKDKYSLDPLAVFPESEEILTPQKVVLERVVPYRNQIYQIDGYNCVVQYSFVGTPNLFSLSPSSRILTGYEINVDSTRMIVSFSFTIDKQDSEIFLKEKNEAYSKAFANIENLNADVAAWNNSLDRLIEKAFRKIKDHYLEENNFFEAIKVKVDQNTKLVFAPPTIQKKAIPQPTAPKNQFTTVPSWPMELYEDTLTILYQQGRSMEQKPSTYRDRDEEDIRDYLITLLETRYTATTVSGETFNKKGKTDILIKYQDGSNLFVGECKWWNGENEFNAAINQLFDRYLTWRDSKTALLFFVKNKEISAVCDKIKEAAQKHPYFKRFVISKGEGRYSFIFHLPSDPEKEVFLEIMAFHFLNII